MLAGRTRGQKNTVFVTPSYFIAKSYPCAQSNFDILNITHHNSEREREREREREERGERDTVVEIF